jgi:hypothetical protein
MMECIKEEKHRAIRILWLESVENSEIWTVQYGDSPAKWEFIIGWKYLTALNYSH